MAHFPTIRYIPRGALVALCAALIGGCARVPAGVSTSYGKQLIITMTVAGQINPLDYYFCVINNANDTNGTNGPEPTIGPPWGGNGFVVGAATQFIEYNGANAGDGYVVQNMNTSGGLLLIGSPLPPPVQDTPVTTGSNTLEFSIPLSELATASIPASAINYIQINFINCDTLPVNTNDVNATHDFDSLGNTVAGQFNKYITISTLQDTAYSNSTAGELEPPDDVAATTGSGIVSDTNADATNLDITNWSVQITG